MTAAAIDLNRLPPEVRASIEVQAPPWVDIKDTARAALAAVDSVLSRWLPDGKRQGPEWVARNPTRHDDTPGSFSVNAITGAWSDFATGDRGGDLVSLVAYLDGLSSQGEAARRLSEFLGTAPIPPAEPAPKAKPRAMRTRPTRHPKLGEPSMVWDYLGADGTVICAVLRFEADNGKEFRPLALTPAGWRWKAPPEPRPLYGLDRLAARPDAPVLLCEGERAADAAGELFPEMVAIASMNGAKSPAKADWSPVAGRLVRIWPDADDPGAQYARSAAVLAYAAGAVSVEILNLNSLTEDPPEGWDAADALVEGWTPERIARAAQWEKRRTNPENHRDSRDSRDSDCSPRENPCPTDKTRPGQVGQTARPTAPDGWKLTGKMVFEVKAKEGDPDEFVPICGPLWVVGRSTGAHREWGLVVEFQDHDKARHRFALPSSRLHEDAGILARELATMGLRVVPGKEKRLLAYLDAWSSDKRIPSAKRLGWQDHADGSLVYVMPDRVIGSSGGSSEIVYQPERHSPTTKTVHGSGDLESWVSLVAAPAAKHKAMLFSLAAGFSPAFLAFAEASDSFIVHHWGNTSRGKTTLAQIAASPWGCAADPNDAPSLSFIRRWNLTGNGLEGLAEAHSDLPLVLDELGASTANDIRPMVYSIAGGQGKTAMNSARELKEPRAWRTIGISTGEGSLHARMSESGAVKGGLVHRALDIEVHDIAAETPREQRGSVVESIKSACARHYGTAGRVLVETIAREYGTASAARAHLKQAVASIMPDISIPGLPTEVDRALKRFALICAAGEFSARHGLIPCEPSDVRAAVKSVARAWLEANADTDDLRIVASVRAFIHRHAARFQSVNDTGRIVPDRVGFVDYAAGEWMLFPAGMQEAAPGNDLVTIARALKAAGHLRTDKEERLTARVSVEGTRPRLYVVTRSLMSDEDPAGEVEV
jgi:uncharacterized protein (DUF927 family)